MVDRAGVQRAAEAEAGRIRKESDAELMAEMRELGLAAAEGERYRVALVEAGESEQIDLGALRALFETKIGRIPKACYRTVARAASLRCSARKRAD